MNFGKWIVVAFVLFAMFIGTLVTICVRQDVPLVTKNYYNEELIYQDQINRVENTNALAEKPEISLDQNSLHVTYSRMPEVTKGTLKLFRPSDSNLDQSFSLETTADLSQQFEIANPAPGLYRAQLTWQQNDKEYYIEKVVIL